MADRYLGTAKAFVDIEVREDLDKDLRLARQKMKEGLRGIGGESKIKVAEFDTDDLNRKLKRANLQVLRAQGELAAAVTEADKKMLKARVAHFSKMAQEIKGKLAAVELRVDDQDATRRVLDLRKKLVELGRTVTKARTQVEVDHALFNINRVSTELTKLGEKDVQAKVDVVIDSAILDMERLGRTTDVTTRKVLDLNGQLLRTKKQQDDDAKGPFGRFAESLGSIGTIIGPFSLRLGTLMRVLGALSPVLYGMVGGLGALVGGIGGGLAGAMAVGTSAVAGFGLAFLGIRGIITPFMNDLGEIQALQDQYNKQVLKTGENSEQAKDKLKKLNHALKEVSPAARDGYKDLDALRKTWAKMTESQARPLFDQAFAVTMRTARVGMRQFADDSIKGFDQMTMGWKRWMTGLRTEGARDEIHQIMTGFNNAIGPMMRGLGALGTAWRRVAAAGASILPQMGRGFSNWARGLAEATLDTENLERKMRTLADAARRVGGMFMSAGRLLVNFFGAGMKPGLAMIDDMTNKMDEWNQKVKEGGANDFFSDGAAQLKEIYRALAVVSTIILQWADAFQPAMIAVTQFFNLIGKLISALSQIPGMMYTIGAAMAANWAVGKVAAMTEAVLRLGQAYKAIRAGQGLSAATSLLTGATALGAGGAGAGTAGALAKMSKASMFLRLGFAGLAVGAGVLAVKLLTTKSAAEEAFDEYQRLSDLQPKLLKQVRDATEAYGDQAKEVRNTRDALRDARKERREADTPRERRQGTFGVYEAYKRNVIAIREQKALEKEAGDAVRQNWLNAETALQKYNASQARNLELARSRRDDPGGLRAATMSDAELGAYRARHQATIDSIISEQTRLENSAKRAFNVQSALPVNLQRQWNNLLPIIGRGEQALGRLARSAPKIANLLGSRFMSPQNAGQVAQSAERAVKAGAKQSLVIKIIADSSNAEEAIRRLNGLALRTKRLRIIDEGLDDAGIKLSNLDRQTIRSKLLRIIEQGGDITRKKVRDIIRETIGDKRFAVLARTGQAQGAVNSILAAINSIPGSRSTTITVTRRNVTINQTINSSGGAGVHAQERAAGRRAGAGSETALVGEGGGPEYVYDPINRHAFKTGGPQFVNLSNQAYVIPTEARYRSQGKEFLKRAARDLGIEMYAGGFSSSTVAAGQHNRGSNGRPGRAAWQVPERYTAGAVPMDQVENRAQSAKTAWENRRDTVKGLGKDINDVERDLKKAKEADKPALRARLKRLRGQRNAAEEGTKPYDSSLAQLEKEKNRREAELRATKRVNEAMDRLSTKINTERTLMDNAARTNDAGAYNKAKNRRGNAITKLGGLLNAALSKVTHPGLREEIRSRIAALGVDVIDQGAANYEDEKYVAPEVVEKSLSDIIAGNADDRQRFADLREAEARAGTTRGTDDDRDARTGLRGFYQGLIDRGGLTQEQRIEALSAIGQYSDFDSNEDNTDKDAILAQAEERARVAARGQAASDTALMAFGGPGDIGSGNFYNAYGAARGGPMIQINTLHPGDPQTLAAIGSAATAGMGYQGSVDAPRERLGY